MTTTAQRESLIKLIAQACQGGARRHQACNQIGITSRTLQRWLHPCVRPASVLAPQQAQQPQAPQASGEAAPAVACRPNQPCTVTLAGQTVARAMPLCADRRQSELRQGVTPHNKLTPQECEDVLAVINSREYKDLPPSQIVPRLADQGLAARLCKSRRGNDRYS